MRRTHVSELFRGLLVLKRYTVAANAEINIPWTLPISQNLMTDMMKKAINSEVGRRTAQAKYKSLRNRVQQLTTAVSTPTTTRQKSIMAQATIAKAPGTSSTRTATTAGKPTTKTARATTTVVPSMPLVVMKQNQLYLLKPKLVRLQLHILVL